MNSDERRRAGSPRAPERLLASALFGADRRSLRPRRRYGTGPGDSEDDLSSPSSISSLQSQLDAFPELPSAPTSPVTRNGPHDRRIPLSPLSPAWTALPREPTDPLARSPPRPAKEMAPTHSNFGPLQPPLVALPSLPASATAVLLASTMAQGQLGTPPAASVETFDPNTPPTERLPDLPSSPATTMHASLQRVEPTSGPSHPHASSSRPYAFPLLACRSVSHPEDSSSEDEVAHNLLRTSLVEIGIDLYSSLSSDSERETISIETINKALQRRKSRSALAHDARLSLESGGSGESRRGSAMSAERRMSVLSTESGKRGAGGQATSPTSSIGRGSVSSSPSGTRRSSQVGAWSPRNQIPYKLVRKPSLSPAQHTSSPGSLSFVDTTVELGSSEEEELFDRSLDHFSPARQYHSFSSSPTTSTSTHSPYNRGTAKAGVGGSARSSASSYSGYRFQEGSSLSSSPVSPNGRVKPSLSTRRKALEILVDEKESERKVVSWNGTGTPPLTPEGTRSLSDRTVGNAVRGPAAPAGTLLPVFELKQPSSIPRPSLLPVATSGKSRTPSPGPVPPPKEYTPSPTRMRLPGSSANPAPVFNVTLGALPSISPSTATSPSTGLRKLNLSTKGSYTRGSPVVTGLPQPTGIARRPSLPYLHSSLPRPFVTAPSLPDPSVATGLAL